MILLIIILLIIIYSVIENKNLKTTTYTIMSDKLPIEFDGMKTVMLSDLHNNTFGKNNEKLIRFIDRENPDYIIIAGDMLTSKIKPNYKNSLKLMEYIGKKYKVYYSMGNHEQRMRVYPEKFGGVYDNYIKKLKSFGIKLLINEKEYINKCNSKIVITGVETSYEYYDNKNMSMDYKYIEKILGKAEKDLYNILIAHNPIYFDAYAKWGADMVLSGHLHGGVMVLPFFGGVLSTQFKLFPKYYGGRFQEENSTLIVSRGLGMHTIKIRILNPPELVVINHKSK